MNITKRRIGLLVCLGLLLGLTGCVRSLDDVLGEMEETSSSEDVAGREPAVVEKTSGETLKKPASEEDSSEDPDDEMAEPVVGRPGDRIEYEGPSIQGCFGKVEWAGDSGVFKFTIHRDFGGGSVEFEDVHGLLKFGGETSPWVFFVNARGNCDLDRYPPVGLFTYPPELRGDNPEYQLPFAEQLKFGIYGNPMSPDGPDGERWTIVSLPIDGQHYVWAVDDVEGKIADAAAIEAGRNAAALISIRGKPGEDGLFHACFDRNLPNFLMGDYVLGSCEDD